MAHRLIPRLLVIALLFQAIAIVPAALAYCPDSHGAVASSDDHCSGAGEAPRHTCPGCLAGLPHGACASVCAALAIPVDPTLPIVAATPVSIVSSAAALVHGQHDAPPDPPPIL